MFLAGAEGWWWIGCLLPSSSAGGGLGFASARDRILKDDRGDRLSGCSKLKVWHGLPAALERRLGGSEIRLCLARLSDDSERRRRQQRCRLLLLRPLVPTPTIPPPWKRTLFEGADTSGGLWVRPSIVALVDVAGALQLDTRRASGDAKKDSPPVQRTRVYTVLPRSPVFSSIQYAINLAPRFILVPGAPLPGSTDRGPAGAAQCTAAFRCSSARQLTFSSPLYVAVTHARQASPANLPDHRQADHGDRCQNFAGDVSSHGEKRDVKEEEKKNGPSMP